MRLGRNDPGVWNRSGRPLVLAVTGALLLMGDVAIRSLNYIAKRDIGQRVTPSGSTYKIRAAEYSYKDLRVFPSYLQTGKSFLIEKSKRAMIAEDIQRALALRVQD